MSKKDTVYLIHLNRPLSPDSPSRHYIGYSDDLDRRLDKHITGNGSRFMEVAKERRISWRVARTWDGGRTLERKLKNRKEAPALCPICSGDAAYRRGANL